MRRSVFVRVFLTFWISFVISVVIAELFLSRPENVPFAIALGSRILVFVVVSLIVSLFTTWGITRPIGWLQAAVTRVAEGNLSTRVLPQDGTSPQAPMELSRLMAEFDQMTARIETLVGSQRQLLADVSHELRSPLARLTLSIELLRKSPRDLEEHLTRFEKEVGKLNTLIKHLLVLSRLETSTMPMNCECFDLSDLGREVVADVQVEAAARGSSISCPRMDECFIRGDYDLLWSASENILRNAVQYSTEGTDILVKVQCAEDFGVLSVENECPQLTEADLSSICRPFYRGDHARRNRPDGSGLGLAIASRAVALHQGNVTARNTNTGVEVAIRLPAFNGEDPKLTVQRDPA